jgi:hypothetical protein
MITKTKSKTNTKSKAKKTTAKKASSNGSKSRIDPTAKLTLVKNPFREGSTRFKWAALVGKSKTAADYLKKGGAGNYLSWLVRFGHVKLRETND